MYCVETHHPFPGQIPLQILLLQPFIHILVTLVQLHRIIGGEFYLSLTEEIIVHHQPVVLEQGVRKVIIVKLP